MSRSNASTVRPERALKAFSGWYDYADLAARGARFEGVLPLSAFRRLLPELVDGEGEARVTLAFAREGQHVRLTGHCEASLHLKCQRCLATYVQPLQSTIAMLAVESEGLLEQADGTGETDAVILESRIRPLDLVEDELLLALPLVPMHPDSGQCDDTGGWIVPASD